MIFVFGGEYQGKKEFVMEKFGFSEVDILDITKLCEEAGEKNEHDLIHSLMSFVGGDGVGAKCIYGLDSFVKAMVTTGQTVDPWVDRWIEKLKDFDWDNKVIVMKDVSQGLVPMDATDRAFREANGRTMIKLAENASEVYRVFCGIGSRIK